MSLTKSQVRSWNPATLNDNGNAWIEMAARIEDLFDRYKSAVTTVQGQHWEGVAADAAQHRADADRRAAIRVADHLERVAKIATDGFHAIDAPLQRARTAITGAEGDGFRVADDLTVSKSGEVSPADEKAMRDWQREITQAANDTERADSEVTRALSAARGDLRVAFVAPAALGGEQAKKDATQLLDDPHGLTPEQIQRLSEAGSLTPAEVDALRAGDTATIPASQMEYINEVARSLDGKTPQEIEAMLKASPPEARQGVANSLELISNEHVTASVRGDADIPTDGGFNLLPTQIQQSLTRGDLVTRQEVMSGGKSTGGKYDQVTLNGVPENQAIARIVGAADPELKAGSSLDTHLLEVGRSYLDAQVQQEQAGGAHDGLPDHSPLVVAGMEPGTTRITEDIFTAVAPDKIAIDGAFNDPEHGQDFVRDLMTHQWTDDGEAAKSLFHFADGEQIITSGEGHAGQVAAERSGNIMEAVARAMSNDDARNLMLNIPGTDHGTMSAGHLNPQLMQEVARSMAPYIPEMAGGANPADMRTAGFDLPTAADAGDPDNWLNPDGRFTGLTNVFTALGTDDSVDGAGDIFRAAADHAILAQQGMYAHDPYASYSAGHLNAAGTIQGAMDKGLLTTLQDGNNDATVSAKDVYAAKERAYDAVSKLADFGIGKLPGSEYVSLMTDVSGADNKEIFIGAPPGDTQIAHVSSPNFDARNAQIVQAIPHDLIQPQFRGSEDYDWMFDHQGNVVEYRTALDSAHTTGIPPASVGAAYQEVLESLGQKNQGSAFRDYYNQVVIQAVAGTQPK